jgi:hypothetical protein
MHRLRKLRLRKALAVTVLSARAGASAWQAEKEKNVKKKTDGELSQLCLPLWGKNPMVYL